MPENPFDSFTSPNSQSAEAAKYEYATQLQNNSATPLFLALSQPEQKRALKLAEELNVRKYEEVVAFGLTAQQALKKFSSKLLLHVQRKDTSKVGEILFQLMDLLDKIDPDALIEKKSGLLGKWFSKQTGSIQQTMSQYNRLSKHIDRLNIQLAHAQQGLLSDFSMLEELYQLNEEYFHEINVYIAAGEIKRQEIQDVILPSFQHKVSTSDNPMIRQELQDIHMSLEWLDRRIYDLEISREIAVQSAPQIRMIQQTHQLLIDKVQESIMSTIPLWQSQISMLLSMGNQRRVSQAQERLTKATDELMRKKAQLASSSKRRLEHSGKSISHADINHFKQTQLKLLQEIEETLRMQAIADEKRKQTESTLT